MIYIFTCDCGYSRDYVCRVKDYPNEVVCDKCDSQMYRDYQEEGKSFILKGSCWERDNYGKSHKSMMDENDKECMATEKQRIKEDKLKGIY